MRSRARENGVRDSRFLVKWADIQPEAVILMAVMEPMKNKSFLNLFATPILFSGFLFAAAPLPAAVIDSFETVAGWDTGVDATATLALSTVTGVSGNAIRGDYDLTGGNYVILRKDLAARDFSGANALRFYYKATGAPNTIEIKFTDENGHLAFGKVSPFLADGAWHQVELHFGEFSLSNAAWNWGAVTRFSAGVTRENGTDGSGVVILDDFQFVAQPFLIDDFETFNSLNTLGLAASYFDSGGATSGSFVYVTTQTVASARGYQLNYSIVGAGQYAGVQENLGSLAVDETTQSLSFWAKGEVGGEPLKIELWWSANTGVQQLPLTTYGTLTTSFQRFTIPLADFNTANFAALSRVNFLVTDGAGAGTFYLEDVTISPESQGSILALEDFSRDKPESGFSQAQDVDARLQFDVVRQNTPGSAPGNTAARLSFDFRPSAGTPWAVIDRPLLGSLSDPFVRFQLAGNAPDNRVNSLEVKVKDSDGTEFIKRYPNGADTNGAWRLFTPAITEFEYLGGADKALNVNNISEIQFAVTKVNGGTGFIKLDEYETFRPPAFMKTGLGEVLQSVATPNNPFSPNGDGLRDDAPFVYSLAQQARVTLKIYDTRGTLVRTLDLGERPSGDHLAAWNGMDDDGKLVRNGIYIFRIEADAVAAGTKDVFREVIGVMR